MRTWNTPFILQASPHAPSQWPFSARPPVLVPPKTATSPLISTVSAPAMCLFFFFKTLPSFLAQSWTAFICTWTPVTVCASCVIWGPNAPGELDLISMRWLTKPKMTCTSSLSEPRPSLGSLPHTQSSSTFGLVLAVIWRRLDYFFFWVSTCCFKTTSALTSFVTFSSVSGNRHLVPCNNWHAGSLCLWKVCFTGVMCGYPWRMMCLLYHCWNSSPDDRCYRTELAMTFLWQIYWWFPWLASLPLLIAHFQIAGDHESILNA